MMIGKRSGENKEEQMRRKETLATEGGLERREEEESGREWSREERKVARLWGAIVKNVLIYITQT